MASRLALRVAVSSIGLAACGLAAGAAWREGLWGTLSGAVLVMGWIGVTLWRSLERGEAVPLPAPTATAPEAPIHRFLLDAAPTPMLAIEGGSARALNRAARHLFATDDRVLPLPEALVDPDAGYLRYEGRSWRVDRVMLAGDAGRMVAALIDIEREERTAEARAAAQLIQVLGHELMNGLAPMASLAESGLEAMSADPPDTALLRDILGTLARHSDGLQRFAEAYRALARLPEPRLRPVRIEELAQDLARLFASRWPGVRLTIDAETGPACPMDREQASQALWAILQNAAEAALAGEAGQPAVSLTVRHGAASAVIEVQDNGRGIDGRCAERMFRPFYTTKPEGTGIGLSLARQVAHAHGGTLTLGNCRPAVFRLSLPKGDLHDVAAASTPESAARPTTGS